MATFKGTVTAVSPIQSGTSKAGREWRRMDVVLTYDNFKPEHPKAIVFSVMNDNIEKFGFQVGGEYEVEVDFATREYQGKYYLSANCWKATAKNAAAPEPQPAAAPAQQGWEAAYPAPQPKVQIQTQTQEDDGLPF